MISSTISPRCYGSSVIITQKAERATCKMTPEQLLGLQRYARAKTATLTPEISIVDPAAPTVIVAAGTQESIPIVYEDIPLPPMLVEELPVSVRTCTPGPLGAIIGFSLFAAVTTAELLIGFWS
jgi:hypothetical protein